MVAEPHSAEHYTAIGKGAQALEAAFGPGWVVSRAHPSRPVLTLEISLSHLAIDRVRKGSLYARAGLADYWVLDLIHRTLEVYREPVTDAEAPFGWRYARREVFAASGRVTPLAAPAAPVAVADLLP